MRPFLSIQALKIQGSRGLEKLVLPLPKDKSGFGTSSSMNREGGGQGDPGEVSPER